MTCPKAQARFWAKTVQGPHPTAQPGRAVLTAPCRLWTGAVKKPSRRRYEGGREQPHGKFWYKGRVELAHRFARATSDGVEPETLPLIGHACDNPRCVEPTHLTLSDPSTNLQEAYDRGRRARKEGQDVEANEQAPDRDPEPRTHLAGLCEWFAERGRDLCP